MNVIHEMLASVPIPKMVKVRQRFEDEHIENVEEVVWQQLSRTEISEKILPGMKIAITCGSRRIDNLALIIRTISRYCKERGADPFIFPAMGSHAGSQAQGQKEICESYGVTEEYCECPIRSSMETISLGMTEMNVPAYIDKYAAEADGIIVVNRIKAHPGFTGQYESGLVKMMVIGMGKQIGAETCHQFGFGEFPALLDSIGRKIIQEAPVLCGVALIENAYDQTRYIFGLTPSEIFEKEPELLNIAKSNMPRLLPGRCDVLVVDRMGKDISGSGMDANITARSGSPFKKVTNFSAMRVVALDLTEASHGSMGGVGNADIINKRIFEKGDITLTYPNSITHTNVRADAIPMMMDTDKLAIQCALKTCACKNIHEPEVIRILDTLHLKNIMLSETLAKSLEGIPGIEILGDANCWEFDSSDNVINCWDEAIWKE